MQVDPDSFVVVIPVTWGRDQTDMIEEVHHELWFEPMNLEWHDELADGAPEDAEATGTMTLEEGGPSEQVDEVDVVIEPRIEELKGVAAMAKEPFTASEASMLTKHEKVWRLVVTPAETDADQGVDHVAASQVAGRLMYTFAEAGAAGAFLPACGEMHSPSMIRDQTEDLTQVQALTNLFVSAWDEDGWMATRGLTCLGLPELETEVDGSKFNEAFFRLMDVAANMIMQGEAYPVGGNLRVGDQQFTLQKGRQGPEDEKVPTAGAYGVLTVRPPKVSAGS
jgi:hypothetical protein